MTRITLTATAATVAAAAALCVPTLAHATTAGSATTAATAMVSRTPGLQVGPPITSTTPTTTTPTTTTVSAGGGKGPAWWEVWDVSGQIGNAIDSWFSGLVTDALDPTLSLVGDTVLSTPQVAGQPEVNQIWLISLGIADSLLALFVLAAAVLVMTHDTLHTRYALKDALPRIALAAVMANASLSLCGQLISWANALSDGFLTGGIDPTEAAAQLKSVVLAALSDAGIFVVLLGLVAAVLAVTLLVLYIVRAATVLILIAAAPLLLLTYVLPQTDGLARLWWRAITAALGVQVAQALVLATAVRVFFNAGGYAALGLSVTGSLIDLLVCICLFWILVRIPFWAKDMALSGRRSTVTQLARSYVLARTIRGHL